MARPYTQPWKFFFIAGVDSPRDVKSHLKREYGWQPNQATGGDTKRMKKRKKK